MGPVNDRSRDVKAAGRKEGEEEVEALLATIRSRARTASQVVSAQKIILIFSLTFLLVAALPTNAQAVTTHDILFDEVGHLAAGMAFVHVAIPLNLTGLQLQASALNSHLLKLSNTSTTQMKNLIFTKQIIEIASFAQHRLARISDQFFLLDNILPVPLEDDASLEVRTAWTMLKTFQILSRNLNPLLLTLLKI